MNERIVYIEKRIDEITLDLLVPIRTSKTINKKAFHELYTLLDEAVQIVNGQVEIRRAFAGLLFFIYSSISAEAQYVDYKDPVFMAASKLEGYLDEILWDSPFRK